MAGGSDIPAYLTEFNDVPYYILVDGEHCPNVDSSSFFILKADRWDESSAVPPPLQTPEHSFQHGRRTKTGSMGRVTEIPILFSSFNSNFICAVTCHQKLAKHLMATEGIITWRKKIK